MKPFRVSAVVFLGLIFAQSASSATSSVGATAGSFAVSPGGAATYSIPIAVPPGVNGMQPNISLNYNSQGGNGFLGVGWGIGGLSSIERCGQTIVNDGTVGGVNLNTNDRFCLDGQRLIAVSGNYGNDGTEYRTEIESFNRVYSYGYQGNGPGSFTVKRPDGTTAWYGYGSSAAGQQYPAAGNTVVAWKINAIQNVNGDSVGFSYNSDSNISGEHRITEINYTNKYGAPIGGVGRKVAFVYDGSGRSDVETAYIGGYKTTVTKRLQAVQTWYGGSVVREYRLGYDYYVGVSTKRSRLTSVQECAADGSWVCLGATTFQWTDSGVAGWSSTSPYAMYAGGVGSGNYGSGIYSNTEQFLTGDFNGDGKMDVFQVSKTRQSIPVCLSQGVGAWQCSNLSATVYNWNTSEQKFLTGDFNGDGKTDIAQVWRGSPNINVCYSTGTSWSCSYVNAGILNSGSSEQDFLTGDFNGDGRTDIAQTYRGWSAIPISFSFSVGYAASWVPNFPPAGITNSGSPEQDFIAGDFNGDGRTDIVQAYRGWTVMPVCAANFGADGGGGWSCSNWSMPYLDSGSSEQEYLPGDINGDGKTDIIRAYRGWTTSISYCLSTGGGWDCGTAAAQLINSGSSEQDFLVDDFNGDGKADVAQVYRGWGTIPVCYSFFVSMGGFTCSNAVASVSNSGSATQQFLAGDFNGDGRADVIHTYNGWTAINVATTSDSFPDNIQRITNGLGLQTDLGYMPLTDSFGYMKRSDASYPSKDVQPALNVVRSMSSNERVPAGYGVLNTSYYYDGMKSHQQGRGGLGFARISTTNPDGSTVTTENRQDFPFVGMPLRTYKVVNGIYVSDSFNSSMQYLSLGARYYPYVAQNSVSTREISSNYTYNNTVVGTVTTQNGAPDVYGNVPWTTVSTSDGFTKTNSTIFYNDTVNWRLGLPVRTDVTSSVPGGYSYTNYGLSGTRTSVYSYDGLGRATTEVVQPSTNSASSSSYITPYTLGKDSLVTSYTYDPTYGYRNTVTIGGNSVTSRTTTTTLDFSANTVTTKNALGHTEVKWISPKFGGPTSLRGPNNLYTYWDLDGFGRKIKERRADGTATQYDLIDCGNAGCYLGAGLGYARYETSFKQILANAQTLYPEYVYYDLAGRELRSFTYNESGYVINRDTVYESLGRQSKVSRNYLSGYTPQWTVNAYDALNRVTTVTAPDGAVTSIEYGGLITTTTAPYSDGKTRKRAELRWLGGQMSSVTDALNGVVTYKYDAFGSPWTTTTRGADGKSSTISASFDTRGRKLTMTDPDMGNWQYDYNPFGELIWQKDAKSQVTSMQYDVLGRMTKRTEDYGVTNWYFDTATNGIGKPASTTGPALGYVRVYYYDTLGRLSNTGTSINSEWFWEATTYNANSGKVESTVYPYAGGSNFVAYNKYHVSTGRLMTVSSGPGGTGTRFWDAGSIDVDGNVLSETLGNGVITSRQYDSARGMLTSIQTKLPFGAYAQQNTYVYYPGVPNLQWRMDSLRGFNENFSYDALSRLTSVAGSRVETYQYDSLGNITYKAGVGTYSYANGKPHAVSSVAGSVNGITNPIYSYDANGNQTGGGRDIYYANFNLPFLAQKGSEYQYYYYDADHGRILQSGNTGTTVYLNPRWDIGGHYERETKTNGTVEHNHYIYAAGGPVALYKVTVSALTGGVMSRETNYLHKDHLGSVETITNEAGSVVTSYRYDPWGKQTLLSGDHSITHHGYTGHEMNSSLGLVNMNGRFYDPSLARFIQADPTIRVPTDSQNFNRYSYVDNNPFAATDPSGYRKFWNQKWFRAAVVVVAVVAASVVTGGAAAAAYAGSAAAAAVSVATAGAISMTAQMAIIAGAASGAVIGGYSGYRETGSIEGALRGAASGAVTGALAGGAGYAANTLGTAAARVAANSVVGGAQSQLTGGSFRDGLKFAAVTSSLAVAYERVVGFEADIRPGENRAVTTYRPNPDTGQLNDADRGMNVFGLNEPLSGNVWDDLGKQGGPVSMVGNSFPGGNGVARWHDTIFNSGSIPHNTINNVWTMAPAAIVTYGALLNNPIAIQGGLHEGI